MSGAPPPAAAQVAVAAVAFAALALTLPNVGLTDDADAYLGASQSYLEWAKAAAGGVPGAFGREAIDRHFAANAEHPPVAKWAMAASCLALRDAMGIAGTVSGSRVGIAALATALAWLLFRVCWRHFGPIAAAAAPAFLFTMPRFFFHAHAETLDAAVAATCFFALVAFALGTRSFGWAIGCGPVFGVALATKLNAPFLLAPFVALVLAQRGRWLRGPRGIPLPAIALASVVLAGPLVFFVLWPWLWFDPWTRLAEYARYHLHHYPILFLYFGRIYLDPPAPWHAPFVMLAVATPLVPLALGATGLARALAVPFRSRRGPVPGAEGLERSDLSFSLAVWALASIGAVAFSGGPKYGGEKLFLPLFPALAALAGAEAQRLADLARSRLGRPAAATSLAALLVLPGALSLARIHPFELSYFNALAGGLPGAERLGFETQYYDLIHVELVDWMNNNLPSGAGVSFLPNGKEYARNSPWWVLDGRLRPDLRFVDSGEADVLVLTHEPRWPQYPELKAATQSLPMLWELRVEGVALLTAYRVRRVF